MYLTLRYNGWLKIEILSHYVKNFQKPFRRGDFEIIYKNN